MRLLMLIVALLMSGAAAPAVAGPFEDASAAYEKYEYTTALRLMRPLAEQGEARAQFFLGAMYYLGHGMPQDYATAASWFRKAAEQGAAHAQKNLGMMYYVGVGVRRDYVQAYMWLYLSADQGEVGAIENRDMVAAKMTLAQYAEAQRLAREWKPK